MTGAATTILAVSLIGLAAGCASDDGVGTGGAGGGSPGAFGAFPATLAARWTPPPFATRSVDGERAAVLDACVVAANALGYVVGRVDMATGKIAAARRQTTGFDGARQDTLEINVSTLAPGVSWVATVLREMVEKGGEDGRAGAGVTTGLVRDRAAYDVFFARLGAALAPVEAPAPTP